MAERMKQVVDIAIASVTIGTIAKFLPILLGIPAALYFTAKTWETETVRKLTGREQRNRREVQVDDGRD